MTRLPPRFRVPCLVPAALLLAAALLVGAGPAAGMGVRSGAQSEAQTPPQGDIVPDEVLVKFRDGVDAARAEALAAGAGLAVVKPLGSERTYLLRITDGTSVPEAIERLGALPEVEYAEPNRVYRTPEPPGGVAPLQPQRKP